MADVYQEVKKNEVLRELHIFIWKRKMKIYVRRERYGVTITKEKVH